MEESRNVVLVWSMVPLHRILYPTEQSLQVYPSSPGPHSPPQIIVRPQMEIDEYEDLINIIFIKLYPKGPNLHLLRYPS